MVQVLIATAVACVFCLIVYRLAKPLKRALQWLLATVLLFGSLALAVALGTATELVLPGIGGIVLGGATGAFLAWLVWLLVGTLGIATGGTAFALGGWALATIFSLVAAAGAATTGFGLRTVHQWVVAIPILILALALMARNRQHKPMPLSLPSQET